MVIKRGVFIATTLVFVLPKGAEANFSSTLRAGRPGQATAPFSVGKYVFQVESGLVQDGSDDTGQGSNLTASSANAVVRYGLTEAIELNSGWGYRIETQTQSGVNRTASGIDTSTIGIRAEVSEGDGLSPALGMQFTYKANVGGGGLGARAPGASFILVALSSLSEAISVSANLGSDWDGIDTSPSFTYVLNTAASVTPRLSLFIEGYGATRRGRWNANFDGGFAYLLSPNFQLDLYAGAGSSLGVTQRFVSVGVSYRFDEARKSRE